ncbi:MAG: metallophosphoesterase [Candidatus Acidiferrales bacterium]
MTRQSYTFPYSNKARLKGGLDRWMTRWRGGGVEKYALLNACAAEERLTLAWGPQAGIEVSQHRIRLGGLPEGLRDLRIVQLTDIHHGLYLPLQAVMDAVALANRLEPDIAVFTGDFITYSRAYIQPVAETLAGLRARLGSYAVLGNHDFRVGADAVTRALRRKSIHVLRNQHSVVRVRGHALHLAGVDDLYYGADLARAMRGIRADAATLLLSHQPGILRQAARARVGLVLSGHTHGGQVRLPAVSANRNGSAARRRFQSGLDAMGSTQIYISRGIGTVVVPLRYRCPAEIPVFHLEPQPFANDFA